MSRDKPESEQAQRAIGNASLRLLYYWNPPFPLPSFCRLMKSTLIFALSFLTSTSFLFAGDADWPQWRGPNRDGHAAPQALLQSWPSGGPELVWKANLGGAGYSAVSVVGDKIYTMAASKGDCQVICVSLTDGSPVWRRTISRAGGSDDYNTQWGDGPRSTPTVDRGTVYALSDVGTLAAMDAESSEILWTTSLTSDHGGTIPKWGYSESPLVDGDRVVVTPGAKDLMIALDRKTGQKIWNSKGVHDEAQYVSVMRGQVGSKSFYVSATKSGLHAFDVKDGTELFRDAATGNRIAVIPTPVLTGNLLYHTSAYGAGNTLLKLSEAGKKIEAESVYSLATKSMENHHGGVVLVDGVIFGFTKSGGGNWMAQDIKTGDSLWQFKMRPNQSGSICFADGRLYCYNDKDATVHLVEPTREDWISHGSVKLPSQTQIPRGKGAIWAHPVVAAGKLIIRDQDLLFAYDIAR